MDLKRLVVESKNGSDSIAKDLFVALLGSEDLVLDGEFDSEIKLLKSQKDLEEALNTLEEVEDRDETLVGAIVTAKRYMLISHVYNENQYKHSNGYIGSTYYKGKDGSWWHEAAYAWTKDYEISDELANVLENVFGRTAIYN